MLLNKKRFTIFDLRFTILCLAGFSCLYSCVSKTAGEKKSSTKFDQYYIQGEILYVQHCSNCHQKNGKGLGRVYPPLDSSDYMTTYFSDVICLMKNGKTGELVVNGKTYNQAMPAIPTLTDLEVAEIATYIYNTWSHEKGIIEVKEVSVVLKNCNLVNKVNYKIHFGR